MKDLQLQIRVSREQKEAIKRAATRAGKDISAWVLERCLSEQRLRFEGLALQIARAKNVSFPLADFSDYLSKLSSRDFGDALRDPPSVRLCPELANRIAAMIEYAAELKHLSAPGWTQDIPPLAAPKFDSDLKALRLHLLLNSPPAFKKRNLFVDSSIGDRI